MRNERVRNYCTLNCLPLLAFFFFLIVPIVSQVSPQSCPTLDSIPTNRPRFKKGNKVYYQFHSSVPSSGTQRSQIRTAFANWHSANQSNCSKVEFIEGTAPTGFGYATLTIKDLIINSNYVTQGGGAADFDSAGGVNSLNEITSATISFNHDLRVDPLDLRLLYDPNLPGYSTIFTKQAMHEIGHGMGLNHITGNPCANPDKGKSVMFPACDFNDAGNAQSVTVTSCDTTKINAIYPCPTPSPSPSPPIGGCGGEPFSNGSCSTGFVNTNGTCDRSLQFQNRCAEPSGYNPYPGACDCPDGIDTSPVIIDVGQTGFFLTNAVGGVDFDILAEYATQQRISWTTAGSSNAFLVLDRNGNAQIDNGEELFGNITPQPQTDSPNGFLALAVYDGFSQGGNEDGWIDGGDSIYLQLKLWQDLNHNGFSEASELFSLNELNVGKVSLDYRLSQRTDEFGNQFRYRAKITNAQGAQNGRWAWDVFLVIQQ
jgi:hypothetical protein